MSYRFLPWVRRGLATRITDPDPLTSDPPVRARLPVRVTVSTGDFADVTLRMFGPGDVIGIDPRTIVRTEPVRFARNFPADQMAAIEFDPPDFPWLFTPAAPGAGDRLRPWLALIVVEKQEGVAIAVSRSRPLPALTIGSPAVAAEELPDLAESWAWAHAHVVEATAPASLPDYLRDQPNLNISRLLCPRRLKPDSEYVACLVPTFEIGRLAGLGLDVPESVTTTAPAWGTGTTNTLPLYYHWEFRTGSAGDFETLARRLVPRPVPDTVGFRRMAITTAHPALPALEPDAGGIVKLEGALRSPEAGTGEPLAPEVQPWIQSLVDLLELPASQVVEGASADAEAVAPPIYGSHHVGTHRLGPTAPSWLRELNTDPRHRAAAGIGTEVVRLHQERFMQAAWEQVGDVLKANALLDRARFIQEVVDRIHRRHVAALGESSLLALTAPVHARVLLDGRPLTRVLERSTIPSGTLDASFRRVASPRSVLLTRASRLAALDNAAIARTAVLGELARGERQIDILARPPDGLVSSRLFERIPEHPTGEIGGELGTVGTVPAETVTRVRVALDNLRARPVPPDVRLRPDLAISGIVLTPLIRALDELGEATPIMGTLEELTRASLGTPGIAGFGVEREAGEGALRISVVTRDREGGLAATTLDRLERSPVGELARAPRRRDDGVTTAPPTTEEVGEITGRPPIGVLPPLITDREVISTFATAFDANRAALAVKVSSFIPAPIAIDLASIRATLVEAIDPAGVIVARARLAVRVRGQTLVDAMLGFGPQVRQRAPLDPVMVGPLIPEPLYESLAKSDPERFLPGIGEIPDDTITMLETNPRFVEAFMVGANHEMNRELLWRRYPTDRRGTPFHSFWNRNDGVEDCGPINAFDPELPLGGHAGADLRGSLVLLVRGQLLRRYPNAIVCAVPSLADGSLNLTPSLREDPLFWGRIDPDVTFVGFDLTAEDVQSSPGWYFVIAEQPTEPRFGLDAPSNEDPPDPPSDPTDWSDLHWGHVGVAMGGYLRLTDNRLVDADKAVVTGGSVRARFGRTSADMAAITFQRPARAAVHSRELVAGAAGLGDGGIRPVLAHAILLKPLALGGGG
jgi:hypothetical protein